MSGIPLSEWIYAGMLNKVNIYIRHPIMLLVVMSGQGNANGILENLSTMVRRYLFFIVMERDL